MSTATTAALRGTLEDFGAEEILRFLASTKQSGALVLSGESTGTLWFAEGEIYGADATTSMPLRDAVTATGTVDDAQWDAAWSDASTGVPLSSALSVHASIDETAIDQLVESRIVDAVFELLVTTSSDFEFRGAERHPLAGGRQHSVDELIDASRARLERWREVATVLPSTAAVVSLSPNLHPEVTDLVLTPVEWRVVAHIDGRRSIADVTRLLGASAFDVCATLHKLVTVGAASVIKTAPDA